jgi:hypothetical protein
LTWLGDQVVAPDAALNALSTATKRSAIVEPKRKPLIDDYDPEAHRRAGEKANELFREIVRRAAKRDGPRRAGRRSPRASHGQLRSGGSRRLPASRISLPVTDDLPTARNTLPKDPWLCLFVWCKACRHRGPADLQAIIGC